jgi:phospholipase C
MENHAANQIFGNTADAPYLNQLAAAYGIATNYFGVTHPSLPNYLAAISGDFQGIWDDCPADATVTCAPQTFGSSLTSNEVASASNRPHMFNSQTIVDQLEAHHMTWKAYMQSMPSPGFTGASYGAYAQKHDPFMYFTDIRNNASRIERIVPFTQFNQDVQSGNVPNFAWISPDECNDMHGTPNCASYDGLISLGDTFVRTIVQNITQSSAWKEGSAIVIVWDENDTGASGCCKSPTGVNGVTLGGADVPIIVMTSNGPRHIVLNTTSYNHYSLLATIERIWNLGCLANTCGFSDAALMTKLFA